MLFFFPLTERNYWLYCAVIVCIYHWYVLLLTACKLKPLGGDLANFYVQGCWTKLFIKPQNEAKPHSSFSSIEGRLLLNSWCDRDLNAYKCSILGALTKRNVTCSSPLSLKEMGNELFPIKPLSPTIPWHKFPWLQMSFLPTKGKVGFTEVIY